MRQHPPTHRKAPLGHTVSSTRPSIGRALSAVTYGWARLTGDREGDTERVIRRALPRGSQGGDVDGRWVARLPPGQRVDRIDLDEAPAFPEGPGDLVGRVTS